MAAAVFRQHLREAGLDGLVEVTSAGVGPWHAGEPADPRAEEVLAEHGYPVEHTAAQMDERHLSADLLLAMDHGHLRAVRRAVGDPSRVHLLRSFDPDAGEDAEVPDPYYGGPRGFDDVLKMVETAMPGLLDRVRA
ncbi:low molecular weight protein-tyrosine-phosphatase [Salinifilum aidingensis]